MLLNNRVLLRFWDISTWYFQTGPGLVFSELDNVLWSTLLLFIVGMVIKKFQLFETGLGNLLLGVERENDFRNISSIRIRKAFWGIIL